MPATTDASHRDLKFAEAAAAIRREYSEFLEHELDVTRAALDQTQAALEQTDAHLRTTVQSLHEALTSLEDVRVLLDEKERYIDSLPSVRVKKWIVDRNPSSKS